MEKKKKRRPLTREEALRDHSSLSAPMVFKVISPESERCMMFISKEGIKVRPLRDDE